MVYAVQSAARSGGSFVWFFAPAADLISLHPLADILVKFSIWIPNLIAALLIGFFGFIAAEYVHDHVKGVKGKGHQFIADVAKVVILSIERADS